MTYQTTIVCAALALTAERALQVLHDTETWLRTQSLDKLSEEDWREVKTRGFSDSQLARFMGSQPLDVRAARKAAGVVPTYKRVDTCAAEFAAQTPYLYSCYDAECEALPTNNPKVSHLRSDNCRALIPAPAVSTRTQWQQKCMRRPAGGKCQIPVVGNCQKLVMARWLLVRRCSS